jgi:tensin
LSGAIQVNSSPLFLDHVTVVGIPAFQSNGGCRAFFKVNKNAINSFTQILTIFLFLFLRRTKKKVYQGSVPVHTSSIYNLHDSARHFTMSLGERGLALRGDILVKCYHRHRQPVDGRETIFSLQFHTCAVTQHTLVFQRQDLDDACQGAYQNQVVSLQPPPPPPPHSFLLFQRESL